MFGLAQSVQGVVAAMPDARFWQLIAMLQGDMWDDRKTDYPPLQSVMDALSPQEIASFHETLAQKAYAPCTRRHNAAYSLVRGLSDSFLHSRLAVVANGEETYSQVLSDPSKFPGWFKGAWAEHLMYVPVLAYEKVTNHEFDRITSVSIESFSNLDGWGN